MPDRLYQAIEGAIGLELDGRVFERCAVDLLRKGYYADLRGTLHERDAGMDGISGPDSDPEFILIATTSNDFARNLRSSVKRYVGAGGRGRTVVFATTRKVTGERRLRLRRELLDRWHVQLREVHDQGDFIHLLYHDPQWRRGLLNVAGIAKTLSRFPANARPTPLTHPAGQARAVIGGVAGHPLLRAGACPQRRLLRKGLPGGDHRGVLRRARCGVFVPGRSAAEHPVRQRQAGSGQDHGRRAAAEDAGVLGACVALPVRGSVRASIFGDHLEPGVQ